MRLPVVLLAAVAVVNAAVPKGRPHDEDPPPPPVLPHVQDPDPQTGGMPTPEEEDPYLPAPEENPCFGEGPSCEEILDAAGEVLSELLDQIPGPTSSSSTVPLPTIATVPTALANAAPVYDVATAINIDTDVLGVLNAAELDMYSNDPLCFFANIERQYISAATATSTAPTTTAPATTTAPTVSTDIVSDGPIQYTAVYTIMGSSEAAVAQTYLFESFFPYWISSLYAPVSNSPNATVSLVTSTTTCNGLDGAPAFTTPYIARASMTPPSASSPVFASSTSSGAAAAMTRDARGSKLAGAACLAGLAVLGAM